MLLALSTGNWQPLTPLPHQTLWCTKVCHNMVCVCVCVLVCVRAAGAWAVARLWHCDSDMTTCNCLLHSNQRGVNNAASLGFLRCLAASASISGSGILMAFSNSCTQVHTCKRAHTQTTCYICWEARRNRSSKKANPTLKASFFCISGRPKNDSRGANVQ